MSTKTSLLEVALGEYQRSGNELLFFCEFCKHHKKKFSVNIVTNSYKCWICNVRGRNIRRFLKAKLSYSQLYEWDKINNIVDLNDLNDDMFVERVQIQEQTIDLPQQFVSLANKQLPLTSKFALKYLYDRGLTKEDIVMWKIGHCADGEYKGRIIVPSFNLEGKCDYFVARGYGREYPKYINPNATKDIVFNELYINWNKDIVLVEGVFDAIKCENAIPLLGSTLEEKTTLFNKIIQYDPIVYIALDPDAEKKSNSILNKFIRYDIRVYKIDVTGFDDVGEMTKEQFIERKEQARLINENWMLESQIMAI